MPRVRELQRKLALLTCVLASWGRETYRDDLLSFLKLGKPRRKLGNAIPEEAIRKLPERFLVPLRVLARTHCFAGPRF